MPVYEEKNKVNGKKRYYISFYVKDENGKLKRIKRHNKEWVGKEGYNLAQLEEITLKSQKNSETNNDSISLKELINKKLEQDKSYLKQSSLIRYNEFANKYILKYFGGIDIFELTTKKIIDWHSWLEKQNIHIESMKKIHNLLTSSLDFGIKYYSLNQNVAKIVGNFKNKRGVVKPQIQFLTYTEFVNFIDQEENDLYKDFFTLLFFTGMRRGELLAITNDDIDLINKQIRINKAINPKNGSEATVPKTNKANRIIPMTSDVYKTFSKYKLENTIFGLDKIKPSTLTRKCKLNCKNANINKNIRVHDFRHSFVAMCIESGVQIEKISEYVGHENISTTYDVYSHLYPNAKLELVSKLESFIENSTKNSTKNNFDSF